MEDDEYFQDFGQMGDEDLAGLLDEDMMEYIENNGGELTPELLELLQQAYGKGEGAPAQAMRISLPDLYESCVVPSSTQAIHTLLPLFILCLIFRFLCQLNTLLGLKNSVIMQWFIHMSSALFGLMMLNSFFKMSLMYPLLCCGISYLLLCVVFKTAPRYCGLAVAIFIVLFTLSCELFLLEAKQWHSLRGAQVILSIKIISIASDVGSGRVAVLPNIIEFLGYSLNVGSLIFGPWVSYDDYVKVLNDEENYISLRWMAQVLIKTSISVLCLLYSNCGTHWLILDDSWRWLIAYRDAQSFRFSHYFISFLSDATATLSGLVRQDSLFNGNVARPQNVEVPRSLVEVVTNWNLPIHYWLKTYVFKPLRPHGAFLAVIITYIASALLHGLNFQVSAVLLSLGFYSYIEFVFRKRLSQIFDACIQARRCKEKCDHKYQERHPVVMMVNSCFVLLAIFHLAYLGVMFDGGDDQEKGYTMWHTLGKWAGLDYRSHLVVLGTFVFYWLI